MAQHGAEHDAEEDSRFYWLGSRNHAPTPRNSTNDTFFVGLSPDSRKLFHPGVSIGHGFTESGGSHAFTLAELLAWPEWREHFERSGCAWAVEVIDSLSGQPKTMLEALIARATPHGPQQPRRPRSPVANQNSLMTFASASVVSAGVSALTLIRSITCK